MHRPNETVSSPSINGVGAPTPEQVKKARMLVSLLGADFAKTSAHPFFKELAQTAVRPLETRSLPPDMSKTLAKLVRRLADAQEERSAYSPPSVERIPESSRDDSAQQRNADIMAQHPALIAKHLIELPTAQQLEALRKLRGQTARQVATYLAELKA